MSGFDGSYAWNMMAVAEEPTHVKNEDGTLTYTIKIRDDMKFSDGTPITAKYYIATLRANSTNVAVAAGGNGNAIFALPYTQAFGFDGLYAEGLYRTPAVHTDACGAAMPAFLAELCETIASTYLYLCPDCGAERIREKIAAAADELAGLGGAADDESRLAYWQQAAQTMRSLREARDDAGVEARVQADLRDRMAYIEQIIARNIAAVQRRLR